jgi:hypothetical protein
MMKLPCSSVTTALWAAYTAKSSPIVYIGPPFMCVEPMLPVERSRVGSGPGPVERGEDTPKLVAHQGPGSSAIPNVLNLVALSGRMAI